MTSDSPSNMGDLFTNLSDAANPGERQPSSGFKKSGKKGCSFREEIDNINERAMAEARQRLADTGSSYPMCDLSVWMRDFQKDIEIPIPASRIEGEVPDWLEGTLIRNGPGKQSFGDSKFKHLFDCAAVLHRFQIKKGGTVHYQAKLLKSEAYLKNERAQRIVVTEFGTAASPDPCKTIFNRLSAVFTGPEMTDNCLISVYPFGDAFYAMTETPIMHRINPNNLDTMESVHVSKHVNVVHHSSHPHVMEDGTVYNLGLSVTPTGPKYSIVSFKPSPGGQSEMFNKGQIECQVPARWPLHPAYMHSFGITPHYFIIIEQPFSVSVPKMLANNFHNNSNASNLIWYDKYPTLIHVVDRNGNGYKTFPTETFFFLHTINQYECGDNVILDICAYKDPSMIDCMYLDGLLSAHKNPDYASLFRGRPVRLTLPMGMPTGTIVEPSILCQMGCETPRFNYSRLGLDYRYFYAISADVDLENPGTLIKVDVKTGLTKTWNKKECFPSEAIFVPRPDAVAEDDGVVLSALLTSENDKQISLVILDAASFTLIAQVDFITPGPVPKCLHGWFVK